MLVESYKPPRAMHLPFAYGESSLLCAVAMRRAKAKQTVCVSARWRTRGSSGGRIYMRESIFMAFHFHESYRDYIVGSSTSHRRLRAMLYLCMYGFNAPSPFLCVSYYTTTYTRSHMGVLSRLAPFPSCRVRQAGPRVSPTLPFAREREALRLWAWPSMLLALHAL